MAKIVKRMLTVELESTEGTAGFKVYYALKSAGLVKDPDGAITSPFIQFPVVEGQLIYDIELPGQFALTEDEYIFGVATVDATGNEPDDVEASGFFDFTPPPKVKSVKIS
jgi:hypothetical protein